MYCPACGQQQLSVETRFCSRCGFLLTGVAEVMSRGGTVPGMSDAGKRSSPRKRGLKQGLFIFLLTFLCCADSGDDIRRTSYSAIWSCDHVRAVNRRGPLEDGLRPDVRVDRAGRPNPGRTTYAGVTGTATRTARSWGLAARAIDTGVLIYIAIRPACGADTNDLVHNEPGSVTDSTTKLLQDRDTQ